MFVGHRPLSSIVSSLGRKWTLTQGSLCGVRQSARLGLPCHFGGLVCNLFGRGPDVLRGFSRSYRGPIRKVSWPSTRGPVPAEHESSMPAGRLSCCLSGGLYRRTSLSSRDLFSRRLQPS